MPNIDLQAKFPDLRPVSKPPRMHLINGCGTRIYGRRDYDAQTKSYVATLCFCLLFIPIVRIRAYRVLPSPRGGWYFLGTQPLSFLAKMFNGTLVAALVATGVGVGLHMYTSRPEYVAHQKMVQAQHLEAQGQLTQAAAIYVQFINDGKFEAQNAGTALKNLVENCKSSQGKEAAGVFAAAARVTTRMDAYSAADLVSIGRDTASALSESNPLGALALLDVLRPMVVDPRTIDQVRLPLLQHAVAADPNDMDSAVALASLLVDQDKYDDALALITPFKANLGNGEGARVLGTLYVHQGNLDEAVPLLQAYVTPRLETLGRAMSAYESAYKQVEQTEFQALKNNKGPPDFYTRYESATPDQQDAMVDEYMKNKMMEHRELQALSEAADAAQEVVPVALDLGSVMVDRAQQLQNPAERKTQLEAAKGVFLSIQGVAGETDQYRLFLGQVYFWLGEQASGKALFDDFLKSKGNAPQATLEIGEAYRQVGMEAQARALAEEAYNGATDARTRYEAALQRSTVFKDADDEIAWLSKADPSDPMIKIRLEDSLGEKAADGGRDDEAAAHFQTALDACAKMPRDASSLNQVYLITEDLYQVTGDITYFNRSVDAVQQALALDQSHAVLVSNAGMSVLQATLVDEVGSGLDLRTLRLIPSFETMGYLYHDQAGRDAIARGVLAHPGFAKARAYMDKLMVLSPNGVRGYVMATSMENFVRNDAGLSAILKRMEAAKLDVSDMLRQTQESLAGTHDARDLEQLTGAIKRQEGIAAAARPLGGATAACAIDTLVNMMLEIDVIHGGSDPDRVVALAQEADRAASSSATVDMLVDAYTFRALKTLRQANPAMDQFAGQYGRSLGPLRLLAFQVQQNQDLGRAVLANPDFQQAVALLKKDLQNFPQSATGYEWAIFSVADPAEAARLAKLIGTTPRTLTMESIAVAVAPIQGESLMDSAWISMSQGRLTEARTLLTNATAAGAVVPQIR